MEKELPTNLKLVKQMVQIPVYKNIRVVNGNLIAAVDGYSELPIEFVERYQKK